MGNLKRKQRLNKNKKSSANVAKMVLIAIFLFFAAFALFAVPRTITALRQNIKNNSPIFSINGDLVPYEEFKLFMDANRANTISQFQAYYNDDNKNFWDKSYESGDPKSYLLQAALDACAKAKVVQQLAKANEIIDDTSFHAFVAKFKNENARRTKAAANNEVLYGPEVYSEWYYYNYLLDDYRQQLLNKDKLIGDFQIWPSEDELKSIYEKGKDSLYKNAASIKVFSIYIPYKEKGQNAEYTREEAKTRIDGAAEKINGGASFEEVASLYNGTPESKDSFGERVFDAASLAYDTKYEKGVREYVENLNVGQASEVFEYQNMYGDAGFYIFKCIEKTDTGYIPFEQVAGSIQQEYADEKYDALVEKMLEEASIIKEKGYDSITGQEIDE